MKENKKNMKIRVLKTTRKALQKVMPFLCKEDAKYVIRIGMKSTIIGLQVFTVYLIHLMR